MSSQRPREPIAEPPYAGALGVTRREHAFVTGAEGAARRVELVRQVNTLTDPLLARQCLDGTLHRAGELDLAVPYVFHDPTARRFVLVVPASRAHEELTLRAELLFVIEAIASPGLPPRPKDPGLVPPAKRLHAHADQSARMLDREEHVGENSGCIYVEKPRVLSVAGLST